MSQAPVSDSGQSSPSHKATSSLDTPPREQQKELPADPSRKHIAIAEDVVAGTHSVPSQTPQRESPPPRRASTSLSTSSAAGARRGSRQASAGTIPITRVSGGYLGAASASASRAGRATSPVSTFAASSVASRRRSTEQTQRYSPPQLSPHSTPEWHPSTNVDSDDVAVARRSATILDQFVLPDADGEKSHRPHARVASASSDASSDNSGRTYGQREEEAWLHTASYSEPGRDTMGRHVSSDQDDEEKRAYRWRVGMTTTTTTTTTTRSHHRHSSPASSAQRGQLWSDSSENDSAPEEAGKTKARQAQRRESASSPDAATHTTSRRQRRWLERNQYRDNWSQVVLTVTSALLFVIVVCLLYALYRMTIPYWRSIWTSVLLSIVLHPRSRLRYSLYKGTCLHRMERLQRRWARRGPPFGIVGAWCSLLPFASFVVMQGVFFFGLNKMERRVLVEEAVKPAPAHNGADAATVTSPLATPPLTATNGSKRDSPAAALASTLRLPESAVADLRDSATQPESTEAAATGAARDGQMKRVPQRQRIVSTVNGRRVLRLGMVSFLAVLAHLLLGIQYFLLMHVLLFIVFALCVPLLSTPTFVTRMSRLWRGAVALFLIVGLAVNLVDDITSITGAVRRTTTELVTTRAAGLMVNESVAENDSGLGVGHIGPQDSDSGSLSPKASSESLIAGLWDTYKSNLSDLVTSYVLQELTDTFNDTAVANELLTALHLGGGSAAEAADDTAVSEPSVQAPSPSSCSNAPSLQAAADHHWSVRKMWSAWFSKNLTRTIVYSSFGAPESCPEPAAPSRTEAHRMAGTTPVAHGTGEVDWLGVSQVLAKKLLPYAQSVRLALVYLCGNVINFFDSIYALMLFVFFFRFLTSLEHTVLYYAIAKLLKVLQPNYGEVQARHIEQDITVSFITLLQSFWHLTWFHFSITFCVFKWLALPTPFLFGTVSVVLALFPLVPKWMSPCAVAMVICAASRFNADGVLGVACDVRVVGLLVSTSVDMSDEWLLCVSRSIRGNFLTDAAGFEQEQLHPFVVGTALVLGFVAWGAGGIVLGPLTVIVAKVIYDNWDKLLASPDLKSDVREMDERGL